MCGLTAWETKIDGVSSFKKGGGRNCPPLQEKGSASPRLSKLLQYLSEGPTLSSVIYNMKVIKHDETNNTLFCGKHCFNICFIL